MCRKFIQLTKIAQMSFCGLPCRYYGGIFDVKKRVIYLDLSQSVEQKTDEYRTDFIDGYCAFSNSCCWPSYSCGHNIEKEKSNIS
ncbi:MAG: hypothetical protein ABIN89_26810 [Chitinophagaceae bacterium]